MILQLAQIDLKLITKVLREGISFKLVFPSIASLFLAPSSVLWLLYAPKAKAQSASASSLSIAQRETMDDNNFQTQTDRKSELN